MKNDACKKGRTFALLTLLFLCGCNKETLAQMNRAMSGMPQMSASQVQAMNNQLSSTINDKTLRDAREDAKPTLEKVLTILACYPNWDIDRYLTAYTTPEKSAHQAPVYRMKYHPKSQCVTVTRLDSWHLLAKNAFSLRAVYVSDASGESWSDTYQMIKQADGTWLLR